MRCWIQEVLSSSDLGVSCPRSSLWRLKTILLGNIKLHRACSFFNVLTYPHLILPIRHKISAVQNLPMYLTFQLEYFTSFEILLSLSEIVFVSWFGIHCFGTARKILLRQETESYSYPCENSCVYTIVLYIIYHK